MLIKGAKYLFILFMLTSGSICYAAEGCVVNNNELFSSPPQSIIDISIFSNLHAFGGSSTAVNNCFTGTSAGTCYVCDGGRRILAVVDVGGLLYTVTCVPSGFILPVTAAKTGTYYSSYVLECNLDDYSWALGATAGFLGLVFIKRRIIN